MTDIVTGLAVLLTLSAAILAAYSFGLKTGREEGFFNGWSAGWDEGFSNSLDATVEEHDDLPDFLHSGYCEFCAADPRNLDPERRCSRHQDVDYDD